MTLKFNRVRAVVKGKISSSYVQQSPVFFLEKSRSQKASNCFGKTS